MGKNLRGFVNFTFPFEIGNSLNDTLLIRIFVQVFILYFNSDELNQINKIFKLILHTRSSGICDIDDDLFSDSCLYCKYFVF